jgi:hypothetical protein
MPFLQPAITRIASGTIQAGTTSVAGTDLYQVSGGGGGGTVSAPFTVSMTDGRMTVAEDQFSNCGLGVSRTFAASPDTNRSYVNVECRDASSNLLSYGGIAHQNNGTNAGLFTQFVGLDASLNTIGAVIVSKAPNGGAGGVYMVGGLNQQYYVQADDSAITMGNGSSATPNVRVTGSSGTGQVFDNLYNNPNMPTYSSVLGAGAQTANTPAGGAYTPIAPAFAVDAEQYYRVSVAGSLSSSSNNGQVGLIIKFNTTADQIILQSILANTATQANCSTIEFRVPTGNTQMTIGVEGYGGFGGSDVATGAWTSLSIVQIN